jgi:hypothetical protein
LVASPIIHFAYDGLGASLGTLAVRVGLPAAGALVGAGLASDCRKDLCSLGAAGLGMAVGMGAAMVVDVAVLAWRDTPAEQPSATLRLAPTFQKDGGGLALAMRF